MSSVVISLVIALVRLLFTRGDPIGLVAEDIAQAHANGDRLRLIGAIRKLIELIGQIDFSKWADFAEWLLEILAPLLAPAVASAWWTAALASVSLDVTCVDEAIAQHATAQGTPTAIDRDALVRLVLAIIKLVMLLTGKA